MPLPVATPLLPGCRVGQYKEGERPRDAAELASRLLYSVYMGTEVRQKERDARGRQLVLRSWHYAVTACQPFGCLCNVHSVAACT